jgi:HPt (histidine-containing phosphotransfer) domain-containing protein
VEPPRVFDLDEAVARCYGKYGLFQDIVECLFDEAEPLLDAMRTALADGNAIQLTRAAHRLKGTVGYLGAPPAMIAVGRLEHIGLGGELSGAAEAIEQLVEQLGLLKAAVSPHRLCGPP